MTREQSLKELQVIPGVGKSIAKDLWDIDIRCVEDLIDKDPQKYSTTNRTKLQALYKTVACCTYFVARFTLLKQLLLNETPNS